MKMDDQNIPVQIRIAELLLRIACFFESRVQSLQVPAAVIVGGANPAGFQPTSLATTARALGFRATTKQEIQRHHRQNVQTNMVCQKVCFCFSTAFIVRGQPRSLLSGSKHNTRNLFHQCLRTLFDSNRYCSTRTGFEDQRIP